MLRYISDIITCVLGKLYFQVSSYVNAIKRGWLVPKTEAEKDAAAEEKRTMKFYNLWSDDVRILKYYKFYLGNTIFKYKTYNHL